MSYPKFMPSPGFWTVWNGGFLYDDDDYDYSDGDTYNEDNSEDNNKEDENNNPNHEDNHKENFKKRKFQKSNWIFLLGEGGLFIYLHTLKGWVVSRVQDRFKYF